MPTLTISVDKKLKARMDQHPHIYWAAYVKERLLARIREIRKINNTSFRAGGKNE